MEKTVWMPQYEAPAIAPVSNDGSNDNHNSTYDIISRVAYLIGVSRRVFENERDKPELKIFEELDTNKNARIIRNLCILRNNLIRGHKKLKEILEYQTPYKNIFSITEYTNQEAVEQLTKDGVAFYNKHNKRVNQHIVELNLLINDRINNCKDIFPVWLNWEYIRSLFIMPDGLTEEGVRHAVVPFYANVTSYPYKMYINWTPENYGNILYNDKKFVTLLYKWHRDRFTDFSKVSDAAGFVKNNIRQFIDDASKVIMVVDCENSDPYRLYATLKGLEAESTAKILKLMLIDDVNTVDTWRILESYISIPVEHVMTKRIKAQKSLVDIELTALTCRECYKNGVDSFIVVSSDSDYWGMFSTVEAKFLVMVEREKCSPDMKNALTDSGIFYCYIENFYTGECEDLQNKVLFNMLKQSLENGLLLPNIKSLLSSILDEARIDMAPAARQQFYDKYLKPMRLVLDDDGNASIELNIK